jgi:hypothetical protein
MSPDRRLHEIWVGELLSGVFFSRVSNLVFLCLVFFLWSQICSLRLVFLRHAPLHTVVAGFFRFNSLQPWPCRFFMLGAWPTHASGVSPWTGACGSRLVFQGAVGGFSMILRSSDEFLLQRRSPVVERGLHGDGATQRRSRCWLLF